MKKSISIVLALALTAVLGVSLAACGNDKKTPTEPTGTSAPAEVVTQA